MPLPRRARGARWRDEYVNPRTGELTPRGEQMAEELYRRDRPGLHGDDDPPTDRRDGFGEFGYDPGDDPESGRYCI